MNDRIVITGMGVVSPIGCVESAFWNALSTGTHGAGVIDCLDTSELPRKTACQVREAVHVKAPVGRASKLAVAAARQAAADARLEPSARQDARIATIVGTTMGETEFIEDRLSADAESWLSPEHTKQILAGRPGCIAQNVNDDLGVPGLHLDLYGACAAGNMALAAGRRQLLDDECDIAIVGGADGFSRLAFIGFMRLRVMAADLCRPFDEKRDGLWVGEGAAVFVLERESHARARGAAVRAAVIGSGLSCESYHPTRPHPDGDGLSRAITAALLDADATPADVDYICAHGTGTPQNDAIEVGVMNRAFPEGVPFSSIKALTGHTMGAAAALEAAACILSLQHQTLIPTWHLENPLQPCKLEALKGTTRPGRVQCVVNNSAGFGGYNSTLVLSRG